MNYWRNDYEKQELSTFILNNLESRKPSNIKGPLDQQEHFDNYFNSI